MFKIVYNFYMYMKLLQKIGVCVFSKAKLLMAYYAKISLVLFKYDRGSLTRN